MLLKKKRTAFFCKLLRKAPNFNSKFNVPNDFLLHIKALKILPDTKKGISSQKLILVPKKLTATQTSSFKKMNKKLPVCIEVQEGTGNAASLVGKILGGAVGCYLLAGTTTYVKVVSKGC